MARVNFKACPPSKKSILGLLAVSAALFFYFGSRSMTPRSRHPEDISHVQTQVTAELAGIHHTAKETETVVKESSKEARLERLGILFSRGVTDWSAGVCDTNRKLRHVSMKTKIGNLTFYVYDSSAVDVSVTRRALHGEIFERKEIEKFLMLSGDLPLIDVGANLGLVALQAAIQGRQVLAVEPIPENALRLCRSALDFGHAHLVHVINNAVSSLEGNVTLAMTAPKSSTLFSVTSSERASPGSVVSHAILLDRLLEVTPFTRAALKIDVESHEGHVLAGAERLFQQMDIPMVWMEWYHVKGKAEYGAPFILKFMQKHNMEPYNLISGQRLDKHSYQHWPFSVLWRKND